MQTQQTKNEREKIISLNLGLIIRDITLENADILIKFIENSCSPAKVIYVKKSPYKLFIKEEGQE
jgi:hypothetical protein